MTITRFKVVIPETTQNYTKNSSFERWNPSTLIPYDWNRTVASGTITEKTDDVRFGASSARIQNVVVASGVGMYQNISGLTAGSSVTVSALGKVIAGKAQMLVQNSGGSSTISTSEITDLNVWQRMESTVTIPSGGAIRVMLLSYGMNADAYFDGIQVEQKAYATTYADGSLRGCYFIGENHRSSSIRNTNGGRLKNIELDITGTLGDVKVQYTTGFGGSPTDILTDDYGTLDGAYLSAVVIPKKDIALGLMLQGTDIDNLTSIRRALLTDFSPVRQPTLQNHYLRYTNSSAVEKEIGVIYSDGLSGENIGGEVVEKPAVKFVASDPFFRSPYDSAKQLGYSTAITATSILIRDNNDLWYTLPASTGNTINAIVYNPLDPDELIVGGGFTTFNGVAANYVCKYRISDGTVTTLGTGLGNIVDTVAVDVNGDIYAGGIFTTDGSGNSMKRVAKFAVGATTWSVVGTGTGGGVDNNVFGLKFDNNRNLFITGIFANTTGGTAVAGIAKVLVNTNTIVLAVSGLTTSTIWDVAFGPDNTVYVGGDFTFTGSGKNICKVVDGSTTPVLMAGSLNSIVRSLWYDRKSNLLYVGGQFTAEQNTSLVLRAVCSWNGVAFTEVGNGVDSTVVYVVVDIKGNVIIYGTFTKVNGQPVATQRILKWNGSYWTQLDMELLSNTDITALGITPNGYLSIGTFSTSTTLKSNTHTTVTNNGNAPSTAQFRFNGPGKLQSIKNATTGQFVDLNYTMISGEIVYLDFALGKVTAVSSLYGSILNSVFTTGFDVQPFYLMPGSNNISVFINGTTTSGTTDARIIFRETYYSAD